ncbi:hypothetical protein TNCV_4394431 [Trichonephila clavipes]|uniref:Uncharacterized protein n=1 Tax=Trichonephila clavipes TaxID=2585209 RepID=A0A8X6W529_TRICX|nr:hypothetical protein TNCV_4394431 [Trichonephila clavipes]
MAITDQLKAIPISEFHQCYEEWEKRLQRCVASEGNYFEGDNAEFPGVNVPLLEEWALLPQILIDTLLNNMAARSVALSTKQVTIRFGLVPPQFRGRTPWVEDQGLSPLFLFHPSHESTPMP